MAPIIRVFSPYIGDEGKCQEQYGLAARISDTFVLNKDATVATDNPDDPYGILAATDGDEEGSSSSSSGGIGYDNIIIWPTPIGANFLDLFTEWIGANPTTVATMRFFGEILLSPQQHTWPCDIDPDFFDPLSLNEAADSEPVKGDWVPLGDMRNGDWLVAASTLGAVHLDNGVSKRSMGATVNVRGTRRVLGTIVTPCDGPDKAMVCGNFGR